MLNKKEYHKEYYKNNGKKWKMDTEEKVIRKREAQKRYSDKYPKRNRSREQEWVSNNYELSMYNHVKRTAPKRGLEFNLDLLDIVIPKVCPYLNIPLTRIRGKGIVLTNASIDRIDNTKGYVKGNIHIISRLANNMKTHVSIEQLVAFAKGVIAMHSKEVGLL